MAAPAAGAAIKAAAQVLLKVVGILWKDPKQEKGNTGSPGILVAVCAVAAGLVLALFMYFMAPLGIWALASQAEAGELGAPSADGTYVLPDLDADGTGLTAGALPISARTIQHYKAEERRLADWARATWQAGEYDQYTLPDWRFLWALDTVLSDNRFDDVEQRQGFYEDYHASVLVASYRTKLITSYQYVLQGYETEDERLALEDRVGIDVYRDGAGNYYQRVTVMEEVGYWDVRFKGFSAIFITSTGVLSDEFRYYTDFESAEYGGGWGDGGNALGAYQFDRRYALDDFLAYCTAQGTAHYTAFSRWLSGSIAQGDPELEAAWERAYRTYPDEFARLQDEFEYKSYYLPAEAAASGLGIDLTRRRDCIKGLFASVANLFGTGGARGLFSEAALDDSMSDEQLARAVCTHIIDVAPARYAYGDAYAQRYANELETVLALLSQAPASAPANSGTAASTQRTLAANYLRAARFISERGGRLVFDKAAFDRHLANYQGASVGSSDLVSIAEGQIGNQGGKPYWSWYGFSDRVPWCAIFVSWCAEEAGLIDDGSLFLYSYCPTGIDTFKQRGRWLEGGLEPAPGDIVFFDWDADGVSDHTGIVSECDGAYVYTVEGNTNTAIGEVARHSYPVGDRCIVGYGSAG
jgi:hypothetical protein